MSRFICILFFLFQIALCWAIDLEPPTKKILTDLPIGKTGGALSYLDNDPYEPESPSAIQIHSYSGDVYIVDFHQGVLRYDSNFRYRETISVLGCNRITLTEDSLIAWNNSSGNKILSVYPIKDGTISTPLTAEMPGRGKRQLLARKEYIFFFYSRGNPYGFLFHDKKLEMIPDNEMEEAIKDADLQLSDNTLFDANLGVITDSSEKFFRLVGAPELLYARTKNGQDTVNIVMGTIFSIDSLQRRYIFYHRNGKARIAIAESDGKLIKVFDILAGEDSEVKLSLPCLAPDESIYYIQSNSKGHKVIKIEKQW